MGATIRDQLLTTLQDTMATFITWTPRVIGGLVLLAVALIVIKLIERAMRAVLTRLKLGELVKRSVSMRPSAAPALFSRSRRCCRVSSTTCS